ncbi:MAG: flagellar biosynthesis anti-sigma factor FlgM [Pseudomonadota bacterium]
MPSIELSKLQGASPARALSESDRAQVETRSPASVTSTPAQANRPGVAIEVGDAVNASQPPVDDNRVAEIREALRDGTYPLVPAKIADAMIAARVGFGMIK